MFLLCLLLPHQRQQGFIDGQTIRGDACAGSGTLSTDNSVEVVCGGDTGLAEGVSTANEYSRESFLPIEVGVVVVTGRTS